MNDRELSLSDHLDYIAETSKSVRSTWYGLLIVVAYSMITLAGVRDIDFFAPGHETTLPIINISVSVDQLFIAAPLLVLVLHTYLHTSLIKLWRALAALPSRDCGPRAWDDQVFPLVFSDIALAIRHDRSARHFAWLNRFAGLSLGWGAVPVVLFMFWWRSFPAHSQILTSVLLVCLAVGLIVSTVSHGALRHIMSHAADGPISQWAVDREPRFFAAIPRWLWIIQVVLMIFAAAFGDARTRGEFTILNGWSVTRLSSAQLASTELVPRPGGWDDWSEAREVYLTEYLGITREELAGRLTGSDMEIDSEPFTLAQTSFNRIRSAAFSGPRKANMIHADLRNANMQFIFAPYADFLFARLDGADMQHAILEGAVFRGASLRSADLDGTHLEAANFQGANLVGASLEKAHLVNANLSSGRYIPGNSEAIRPSDLRGVDLSRAVLNGADFAGAMLKGAYLKNSDLRHVRGLTQAQLDGTIGDGKTQLPPGLYIPSCLQDFDADIARASTSWDRTTVKEFEAKFACSSDNPLMWFPNWPPLI